MRSSLVLSKSHHPSKQRWLERQFRDPYVKRRIERGADHFRSRSAFKLLEMDERYKFLSHHGYDKENKIYFPTVVVDFRASPGGWSQVLSMKLGHGKLTALLAKDVMLSQEDTLFGLQEKAKIDQQVVWCDVDGDSGTSYDVRTRPPRIKNKSTLPADCSSTLIALDLLPIKPIPGVLTIQEDFLSPLPDALIRSTLPLDTDRGGVDLVLSDMAPNISGNAAADVARSLQLWEAAFSSAKRYFTVHGGKNAGGSLV